MVGRLISQPNGLKMTEKEWKELERKLRASLAKKVSAEDQEKWLKTLPEYVEITGEITQVIFFKGNKK